MVNQHDVESRIDCLDVRLFSAIHSQSFEGDKTSWLSIQRSLRSGESGYVYLEIGSHLGGSLQQHLVDPRCRKIFSIDDRPLQQPDGRGQVYLYPENSTNRMMTNLNMLAPDQVHKVICFDSDARDLDPSLIDDPPDYCFIDGEHTTSAVISDFAFCLRVMKPNGVVCFHDDWIVASALQQIIRSLQTEDIPFVPLKLGGITFGIFLRDCTALKDPLVLSMASDGLKWLHRRRLIDFWKGICPSGLLPAARAAARHVLR